MGQVYIDHHDPLTGDVTEYELGEGGPRRTARKAKRQARRAERRQRAAQLMTVAADVAGSLLPGRRVMRALGKGKLRGLFKKKSAKPTEVAPGVMVESTVPAAPVDFQAETYEGTYSSMPFANADGYEDETYEEGD